MCTRMVLKVAVLAVMAVAVFADVVDQQQESYITTYKIPPSGIWQSFTPSVSGNLESIGVLVGATNPSAPCRNFEGTLEVYAGEGIEGVKGPFFAGTPLSSQTVVSSDCVCTAMDCVSWQKWTLSSPIAVTSNQVYSFLLTSASTGQSYRVGLMVVDGYARGRNNFAAAGYDYPFRTYMADTNPTAAPVSNDKQAAGGDATSSASNSTATFAIVGAVVIFVLVVVVIFAVMRRRRETKWLSAEEGAAALRNSLSTIETKNRTASVSKKENFSTITGTVSRARSRVYNIDFEEGETKDDELERDAIHDNWVLKENNWEEPTSTAGDMHWRSVERIALPDGESLAGATCDDDFMEDDDMDLDSLPEPHDDHAQVNAILY